MELSPAEGRVLGCLVEKQHTTPQAYPLTDNALITACNQSTNRDPVVSYDMTTVRLAVRSLRERGLLRTVHRSGERTDKHRSEVEQALGISTRQAVLLAVLLLRGPQTAAELRARSERMHAFASAREVEDELEVLAGRDEPLVARLERAPGQKEARYVALVVPEPTAPAPAALAERVVPRTGAAAERGVREPRQDDAVTADESAGAVEEPAGASVEIDSLRADVAALRAEVAALRAEVAALRAGPAGLRDASAGTVSGTGAGNGSTAPG